MRLAWLTGVAVLGSTACTDGDDGDGPNRTCVPREEQCNGADDDCDGLRDEGFATSEYYVDGDGDGIGGEAVSACAAFGNLITHGGDCNDDCESCNPGSDEGLCADGLDNNCDGEVDEGARQFYSDEDKDGVGGPYPSCTAIGMSDATGDCDDHNDSVHPGANERFDCLDNDCDGVIDEELTFYIDDDWDGYGSSESAVCGMAKVSATADDCDDAVSSTHPGAAEVCNHADDDCDGLVDDGVTTAFYADADGDGYGDPLVTVAGCSVPSGHVTDGTDCDDNDDEASPAVTEACADGVDNDCDGTVDGLCKRLVFVASGGMRGNVGGLAGADAICQAKADAQSLGGTYMAWLSDSTDGPDTRFDRTPDLPYVLVGSGAVVADRWDDLVDGSIDVPVNVDESGSPSGPLPTWTGTAASGVPSGYNCLDWTVDHYWFAGTIGYTEAVGLGWTQGSLSCDKDAFLMCFQQE